MLCSTSRRSWRIPSPKVAESSEEAPKRAKAFCLPEGAEVISNERKGNCLFQAVAQGVSDLEKKRVGHRQVRAAVSDWLLQNKDQIESH